MPLFGPFVDKQGPVISAAFCNALDLIQNALSIDSNGGATFAAPSTNEPTITVNTFGNSPGILVNGGSGVVIGSATGGLTLGQDPTGFGNFNNQANQGWTFSGGPVIASASSTVATAIGSAGGGLSTLNGFLLQTGATANAQFLYQGREVGSITPSGRWQIDAPLNDTGMIVNGTTGSVAAANYALVVNSPNTLNKSFGLEVNAGTSASDFCAVFNAAGTAGTAYAIFGDGTLKGLGPYGRSTSGVLADMTPDFGTFVGVLTGFNGSVQGNFQFFRIGNVVTIYSDTQLSGPSNSTSMSLSNVPSSLWVKSGASSQAIVIWGVIDNGFSGAGIMVPSVGGGFTILQLTVSGSRLQAATFTAGNTTKGLLGGTQFTYSLV